MTSISHTTTERCRVPGLLLACLSVSPTPALAADAASEHTQFATLMRQLDMLDRLAEHSATLSWSDGSRYHIDYARLHKDIEHVRSGIRLPS